MQSRAQASKVRSRRVDSHQRIQLEEFQECSAYADRMRRSYAFMRILRHFTSSVIRERFEAKRRKLLHVVVQRKCSDDVDE